MIAGLQSAFDGFMLMIGNAKVLEPEIRTPGIRDAVMREAVVMENGKVVFHTEAPGRYEGTWSDGRITLKKAAGHLMTVLRHKNWSRKAVFTQGCTVRA